MDAATPTQEVTPEQRTVSPADAPAAGAEAPTPRRESTSRALTVETSAVDVVPVASTPSPPVAARQQSPAPKAKSTPRSQSTRTPRALQDADPVPPGRTRLPKSTLRLRPDICLLNAALDQPPRKIYEDDVRLPAATPRGAVKTESGWFETPPSRWQRAQSAIKDQLPQTRRLSVAANAASVIRYMDSRRNLTREQLKEAAAADSDVDASSDESRIADLHSVASSSMRPTPVRTKTDARASLAMTNLTPPMATLTPPVVSPASRSVSPRSSPGAASVGRQGSKRLSALGRKGTSTSVTSPAAKVDFYQLSCDVKAPPDILMLAHNIFKEHVHGNSWLSWDDFGNVLCELTRCKHVEELPAGFMQNAFELADLDKDEGINLSEFALWYSRHAFTEEVNLTRDQQFIRSLARKYNIPIHEVEDLKMLFDRFDENGTGDIEFVEFWSLLAVLVKQPRRTDIPAKRVKTMWKNIDIDGSGVIGFEEFLVFYKQHFGGIAMKESPFEEFYRAIRPVPVYFRGSPAKSPK